MRKVRIFAVLAVIALLGASAAEARECSKGRSSKAAMWWSILHPGVGEYYLKGWGSFSKMPPLKFWLGFIPVYGWPGYLQVRSAVDASRCETLDRAY